eukprot:scaffold2641_cov380-Prasinococcus_capsulatus_cf.AAC.5
MSRRTARRGATGGRAPQTSKAATFSHSLTPARALAHLPWPTRRCGAEVPSPDLRPILSSWPASPSLQHADLPPPWSSLPSASAAAARCICTSSTHPARSWVRLPVEPKRHRPSTTRGHSLTHSASHATPSAPASASHPVAGSLARPSPHQRAAGRVMLRSRCCGCCCCCC